MQLEHLGPALRLLRERRFWKQKELARRAGVTRSRMSAYELGRRLPSLRTLHRLLQALGVDLRHLHAALHAIQEQQERSHKPSSG
jgi:transcriptional regulator with XRE-family HTH domain